MSGHLKISALAILLIIASVATTHASSNVKMGIVSEEMEQEIKAMTAMKEFEKTIKAIYAGNGDANVGKFINLKRSDDECASEGHICSPAAPEMCCSGSCVGHPYLRIFVCASA